MAYVDLTPTEKQELDEFMRNYRAAIGDTVRGLYEAAVKQGIIDCSGSGLGCVLIRRKVIEETPFEAPEDPGFMDWGWTQTAYRKGYRMRADLGVQCGHKDINGEILWANTELTADERR